MPPARVQRRFAKRHEIKKRKKEVRTDRYLERLERKKEKAAAAAAAAAEKKDPSTLSIAVPGSILDNAPSHELKTYLAGQIARAACVFKVDEIIVYDDVGIQDNITAKTEKCLSDSGETLATRKCCAQLARILQYLECPQYLRKDFFPYHRDLEYAGLLNPLDAPHHMRQQDDCRFREGIVTVIPSKNTSYANVGLLQMVKLDLPLKPGIRVTVEMLPSPPDSKRLHGRVVSPNVPHNETGVYWGYSVRLAKSLNAVFTECPYKGGYDVPIGTSEHGEPVDNVSLPSHQHALIVFGGLAGLEGALEADDVLSVDDPALLFDHYVNTCPEQGSRTIRTEEAILISLAALRTKLKPKVQNRKWQGGDVGDNDQDSDSGGGINSVNVKEASKEMREDSLEVDNESSEVHQETLKRIKPSSHEDSSANLDHTSMQSVVNGEENAIVPIKIKKKKKKKSRGEED